MRTYELMYIVKPDLDEEQLTAVMEKYTNLIINNGGEIISNDKWGKRKLAYEIRDYRDGIYILVNFKGDPAVVNEVDRIMKIAEDILRFMIIVKEK